MHGSAQALVLGIRRQVLPLAAARPVVGCR